MALVNTESRGTIQIAGIAADWDWETQMSAYPSEVRLHSITFIPAQANDKVVVKDGSDAGAVIFRALCLNTDEKIKYFNGAVKHPYIDFSEGVHTAGSLILIDLWPSKR